MPTIARRMTVLILAVVAAPLLQSCATPKVETANHYGDTKKTAIEVCRPQGERAYLSRLVCPGGEAVIVGGRSNVGWRSDLPNGGPNLTPNPFDKLPPGVDDWHIVDAYQVTCGASKRTLFLDMYHCDQAPSDVAPPGLTLRPAHS